MFLDSMEYFPFLSVLTTSTPSETVTPSTGVPSHVTEPYIIVRRLMIKENNVFMCGRYIISIMTTKLI